MHTKYLYILTLIPLLLAAALHAAESSYEHFYRKSVSTLPGKPTKLFDIDQLSKLRTYGEKANLSSFSIVDAKDQSFKKSLRVVVQEKTENPWNIQISSGRNFDPVKKGDTLFIAFSIRTLSSDAETDDGVILATLQQKRTYESLCKADSALGGEWMQIYMKTKVKRNYPKEEIELVLHLGSCKQTLELGGFLALNLGQGVNLKSLPYTHISYVGQSPDAAWRSEALKRIDTIRKADLSIEVTDSSGRAVKNAKVAIRMTRHAYQFGTFIGDGGKFLEECEEGKRCRDTTLRLFNRVTCPIYWHDWGWQNPKLRAHYIALAQWAKDNNFYTRGHCLIWPSWKWMPKEVQTLKENPKALKDHIDKHFVEVISAMKIFKFDDYDVINELRANHDVPDILGYEETAHWFKLTHKLDPHPKLGINDYDIVSGGGQTDENLKIYKGHINDLIDNGAPLSVIGVQCHMGENMTPPADIIRILDSLSEFKLPIHATEFDISTYDEKTQGDYMRDFLIAFFSHPATESITQWGFKEDHHWIPRAAMIDKNWRIKPNGKAYIDLVLNRWWTNESLTTGSDGKCALRGFKGKYTITVTMPDKRVVTRNVTLGDKGLTVTMK